LTPTHLRAILVLGETNTVENDFSYSDEGSIVLLTPITAAANDWVQEHLPGDAMRFGHSIVIEHRYADDILNGIVNDGLLIA
jgi:hypothetical protein